MKGIPIFDRNTPSGDETSATKITPNRPEVEETAIQSPVTFDELGDLHLCVGANHDEKPSTFIVCSRTLARVSPVFKKMLFGGFAESRASSTGDTDWNVHLPDDKPRPLRYLLYIMHGNFKSIPRAESSFDLFEAIVLADKYDCIDLFRPWANAWSGTADEDNNDGYLLYIGWELGDIALVRRMALKIANECTISPEGKMLYDFSMSSRIFAGMKVMIKKDIYEALGEYLPTSILDQIVELRDKLIEAEMKPFVDIYESLRLWPRCQQGIALFPTDANADCDLLLLGSLVKGFFKIPIELGSENPPASYKGSAKDLEENLKKIKLSVGGQSKLFVHEDCEKRLSLNRTVGYLAADALRKQGIQISSEHQSRILGQREKTGVL